jgi:hypothetical protein
MQQKKPAFLEELGFAELKLGRYPPRLSNFIFYPTATRNAIFECELTYGPNHMDASLYAKLKGKNVTLVKVAYLFLRLRVRVVARLKQNEVPFVKWVRVQLLDKPEIDVNVQPLKSGDVFLLPGFGPLLKKIIADVLLHVLGYPNFFEQVIDPTPDVEDDDEALVEQKGLFASLGSGLSKVGGLGVGALKGVASLGVGAVKGVGQGVVAVGDLGLSGAKAVGNLGASGVKAVGGGVVAVGDAGVAGVKAVGDLGMSGVKAVGKGVTGLVSSPFGKKGKKSKEAATEAATEAEPEAGAETEKQKEDLNLSRENVEVEDAPSSSNQETEPPTPSDHSDTSPHPSDAPKNGEPEKSKSKSFFSFGHKNKDKSKEKGKEKEKDKKK